MGMLPFGMLIPRPAVDEIAGLVRSARRALEALHVRVPPA